MQTVNLWVNNSSPTPTKDGYFVNGHQSPLQHPGNESTNYGSIPRGQASRGLCWNPALQHSTGLRINVATQWASALASSFYEAWPPNEDPPVSAQNCLPGDKVSSPRMWKSPTSQHNWWTPISHEAAYNEEAKEHNFCAMPNLSQTWGVKVDQMKPWNVGATTESQVSSTSPKGWSTDPCWAISQWHQTVSSDADWTNNSYHPQDDSGWNVIPEQHLSSKHHGSYDGTSNWSSQLTENPANDMVWHDPTIKIKKHVRDTGTAIWGDPEMQKHHYSEIRHWKNADNSNYGYTPLQPGTDWTNVNKDYYHSGNHWTPKPRHTHWVTQNALYDPHDDKQPETLIPKLAQFVQVKTFFETLNEIRHLNPTVGKQISDQFEGAVNRKWVQPFVLKIPLTIEFAKLHQLVKRMFIKENQMLKLTTRPATLETPMKKEKILSEMQQAQNELNEVHCLIGGGNTSTTSPADGQSRLRQWKSGSVSKQNNADNNSFQRGNSFGFVSNDTTNAMNAILNATKRLSINTDDVDTWKQGILDWSLPKSCETPRKSSNESNHSVIHEPQEFIPGKKWEWRDPSKIAEDPNATPGSCKPNPLLTASSALCLQLNTIPKETNTIMSPNNQQNSVDWRQMRKQSRSGVMSSLMSPNSSHYNETNSSQYWLMFQLDNITESQFHQICHRAGRVINFCMITAQYACVKFNTSNTDYVIQCIKSEYPFMPEQLRFVSDDEFANMIKQAQSMFDVNSFSLVSPWNS